MGMRIVLTGWVHKGCHMSLILHACRVYPPSLGVNQEHVRMHGAIMVITFRVHVCPRPPVHRTCVCHSLRSEDWVAAVQLVGLVLGA